MNHYVEQPLYTELESSDSSSNRTATAILVFAILPPAAARNTGVCRRKTTGSFHSVSKVQA